MALNSTAPDVLIYKRTHPGDPDGLGRFGNHDCMGRVRNCRYEFVIGVGGISGEPCSYSLDRKINWVGRWPKRRRHPHPSARGDLIEFARTDYLVLEDHGPLLQDLSPALARRLFSNGNRFLNRKLSVAERREAARVVNEMLNNPNRYGGNGQPGPGACPPDASGCGPRRCSRSAPRPRAGGC
jgi:hypothetical protein